MSDAGSWGDGPWGTGTYGGSEHGEVGPPSVAAVGSWGLGPWGTGSWGGLGEGGAGGPGLGGVSPTLAEVEGGTVIGIFGENFTDPVIIELVDGDGTVLSRGQIFEARLDLRLQKMLVGFPPMPPGVYGIQVTTDAGTSPILPDAVTYKEFAQEGKVQRARRHFAQAWATGERLLS